MTMKEVKQKGYITRSDGKKIPRYIYPPIEESTFNPKTYRSKQYDRNNGRLGNIYR